MDTLRGLEFVQNLVPKMFEGCDFIKDIVVSESEHSNIFDVSLDVEVDLIDADFDYVEDLDNPKYVDVNFTGNEAMRAAPQMVLKHLINSGKIHLNYIEGRRTSWKVVDTRYVQFFSDSMSVFDIDEEDFDQYLENPPKIKIHYSPMKVRGVMDADPEEYSFDIYPYDKVKVRVLFQLIGDY